MSNRKISLNLTRHELPTEQGENATIEERYRGEKDPAAKKLLQKAEHHSVIMSAPADKSIKTIYLTGIVPEITESDIRHHFYGFGEITNVLVLSKAKPMACVCGIRILDATAGSYRMVSIGADSDWLITS